jgi:hypothetical protein
LVSGQLYNDYAQQMNTMNHMVNAMVVVIGCIVTVALWSFIKVNPWFKIAAEVGHFCGDSYFTKVTRQSNLK